MKPIHRYPGVKPFEFADRQLFFGREKDIDDLYDLIRVEKVTVLFSKSGYGKSSLINAGIIPRLQEEQEDAVHYRPVVVRFGNYEKNISQSPLEAVRQQLEKACPQINRKSEFLEPFFAGRPLFPDSSGLWFQCKRRQLSDNRRVLFIFDQFEEFFSYPVEQQGALKKELAELLYVKAPQELRDRLPSNFRKTAPEQAAFLAQSPDVKLLFSIRSDRLHYLDSLKDTVPDILFNRYELMALSREQAWDAVTGPAELDAPARIGRDDAIFASPAFSYSTAALERILSYLENRGEDSADKVEAFELQLICRRIEDMIIDRVKSREKRSFGKWIKERIAKEEKKSEPEPESLMIYPQDLPDLSKVFKDYYRNQIKKLERRDRRAAHLLIEEGLLSEHENPHDIRRLSVDRDALLGRFKRQGVRFSILQDLENAFLIRSERNNTGGFNYEISHDTLMPPILEARNRRRIYSNFGEMAAWAAKGIGVLVVLFLVMGSISGWAGYMFGKSGRERIIHDTVRIIEPGSPVGFQFDYFDEVIFVDIDSYLGYVEDFRLAKNEELANEAIREAEQALNRSQDLLDNPLRRWRSTQKDSLQQIIDAYRAKIENLQK